MAIEHLQFLKRDSLHLHQVVFELPIAHIKIALVANSVLLRIVFGQLSFVLTADLTNRFGTLLAVPDRIAIEQSQCLCEGLLTEHAIVNLLASLVHLSLVKFCWQPTNLFLIVDVIYHRVASSCHLTGCSARFTILTFE